MDNILVIQAARFGDLVQTRRLILSLARKGMVHLAVDRSLAPLARLLYPEVEARPLVFHCAPDAEAMNFNKKAFAALRQTAYAKVYNCNFSALSSTVCRLFPTEKITGYRPAHVSAGGIERSQWVRLFFRLGASRGLSTLNLVDYWANFADQPIAPELVNPLAKPGGAGLGIALSGREARRSLPLPILAEAARIVFHMLDGPRIKLFGTKAESPAARGLMRLFPGPMLERCVDLSGKTDWANLVEEMSGLDLLLTPDTGLMHLGAFLGVPVLAFFLSSAWCHETGPYGQGHMVLQSVAPCSPCLENQPCPRNVACLAPFASPGFPRLLAAILSDRKPAPLEGLQVWQTGLDSLGGLLTLLSGDDPAHGQRAYIRAMLCHFLGLPVEDQAELPLDQMEKLQAELFSPDDWMLPPWRYC